jgi:aminocarboxymuconate-semialdehyde decarboxylase
MPAITLDTHTHLVPDAALDGFAGVAREGGTLVIDGHALGMRALFQPQALLDWMAKHDVARAWVSAPPPTYRQHLAESESRAWCAALNRGLATICAPHDALVAMAHLPVEHPSLAAEIVRDEAARGQRRFSMPAGVPGRMLSEAAYAPLWAALEAARGVLLLHPGDTPDSRLESFYLGNLAGNPQETGIAGVHLVLGGVLQRHPGLRVILAHAGGTLPMLAGRLERGAATARPGLDATLERPLVSLRRLYADPMAHHPLGLALAAEVFGEGHIVFGSDWPFPMGLPDPASQLADSPLRDAIFARDDITEDAP